MTFTSVVAIWGLWLAVPLTGYAVFAHPRRLFESGALPVPTALAVSIAAGVTVWSLPLLAAAVAGAYWPVYIGAAAWVVVLIGGAALWWTRRRGTARVPAPASDQGDVRQLGSAQPRGRHAPTTGVSAEAHADRVCDVLLVLGLLLAAALYLGFPRESIYGGRDEGVYANHAVYLAHHGRLEVPYPWAAADSDVLSHWQGFPGFYQTPGTMTVQFSHLVPVWLAEAYATCGAAGLFRLNGVFALLSVTVFYGVARLLVPSPFALAATVFLAFNPSQLWVARITLSEPLTQLCIWSGLLLLLEAVRDGRTGSARWAGIFLGMAAFVRFDGLIMVPLLLLSHAVWKLCGGASSEIDARESAAWRALYTTFFPVAMLALVAYAVSSAPYFHDVASRYMPKLVAATAAAAGLLLLAREGVVRRLRPILIGPYGFGAVATVVVGLSAYAYWWRSKPSPKPQWKFERIGYSFDVSRDYAQDSFVNLAQYLSPLVLWLAVGGWLLVVWARLRHGRDRFVVPALVIIAGCTLVYLYRPGVYPDHFWAVRRFIPVVIPGCVLCAALGLAEVTGRLPKPWALLVVGAALVFATGFTMQAGQLIFLFAEDEGLFAQFQAMAERLPADAVIVTHGYKTWVTPLYVAFDRKVVPIDITSPEGSALWKQWAARQKERGQAAYLLVEIDKPSADERTIAQFVVTRRFVQPTVYPLPNKIVSSEGRVELYRFPP